MRQVSSCSCSPHSDGVASDADAAHARVPLAVSPPSRATVPPCCRAPALSCCRAAVLSCSLTSSLSLPLHVILLLGRTHLSRCLPIPCTHVRFRPRCGPLVSRLTRWRSMGRSMRGSTNGWSKWLRPSARPCSTCRTRSTRWSPSTSPANCSGTSKRMRWVVNGCGGAGGCCCFFAPVRCAGVATHTTPRTHHHPQNHTTHIAPGRRTGGYT